MQQDSFYKMLEDKHRGSRKLVKERLKIYIECIAPLKMINPQPKALDLGCGRGEWLELLGEHGFDALGIDQEESMLRVCKENNLHVLQEDVIYYLKKTAPESIDLISAFHLVEHLEFDIMQEMIAFALKALKKGGLLLLETPNPENILVASKTFYMDPTHRSPLPPELLMLAVEYQGFFKAKVLRLQEKKDILQKKDLTLLDVIDGVSPDYGIVAQKEAKKEIIDLFNFCYEKKFGISLEELTNKYDSQIRQNNAEVKRQIRQNNAEVKRQIRQNNAEVKRQIRQNNAEVKRQIEQNNAEVKQQIKLLQDILHETKKQNEILTQQIIDLLNSNSWKITKPLRVLMQPLKKREYKLYVKQVLVKLKNRLNDFPKLKFFLKKILIKFPYLYAKLKYMNENKHLEADTDQSIRNLSYREEFFFNRIKRKRKKEPVNKKLAYISPLPPDKSGISFYSVDLLGALKNYYDIELIVVDKKRVEKELYKDYIVRGINYFVQNSGNYGRVLYHFGNSPFHAHMFDLLKIIPGIVILHDFYLSHIVENITLSQGSPAAFSNALYKSHGYKALDELSQTANRADIIWKYPCNLEVLQDATAVIVHSDHAKELAKEYYGSDNATEWHTIPLLRKKAEKKDKTALREKFSLPSDAFVVCSFGQIGKSKLSHRLLDAWVQSPLAKNKKCKLIFVGEYTDPDYATKLKKIIKENSLGENVHITGWVSDDMYKNYLCMADIAVQLRAYSRGETSGAVLDCMNYGLATVVNAHGSMKELSQEALYMIEDDFSDETLAEALQTLYNDKSKRETISRNAQKIIQEEHNLDKCALMYHEAIEKSYANDQRFNSDDAHENDETLLQLAKDTASKIAPKTRQKQLLVDVSAIARTDLKTGIQRVVRSQLIELVKNASNEYRIEPVYLTQIEGEPRYCYAHEYTAKLLGIKEFTLSDRPIDCYRGDIFYGVDLSGGFIIEAAKAGLFEAYKTKGVQFSFVVYDLLPVLQPQFFPKESENMFAQWLSTVTDVADSLICISNAVADELLYWIKKEKKTQKNHPRITSLHLGADIGENTTIQEPTPVQKEQLEQLEKSIIFLMVGTIEPRKGHAQTLESFELLWKEGMEANLVIVGKKGWMVDDFIEKLTNHPMLHKRLFWLEGIDDAYLAKLYDAADALIVASQAEGFGLPLIEAAHHNLPVIARDIPVFREVAQNFAYYFQDDNNPKTLADAIINWLKLYKQNKHPLSDGMPCLTWKQNAQKLMKILEEE